ncbi:MAG: hypothetical protein ACI8XO_003818, partial [Verrucomicrobiales bacterium]
KLSDGTPIDWAIAGESSVDRYKAFSQGGHPRVMVSDLRQSLERLEGKPEHVPNFADVELIETKHAGYYFENEDDASGSSAAEPTLRDQALCALSASPR